MGEEYTLRMGPTSTSRVLMRRLAPDRAWSDIATFASYNDAEWVLRLLNLALGASVPPEETEGR